jgi:ATP phosphoribosyltransferase regulatory subunit
MAGKWKWHVPGGVQDYLPDEYYNKRKIEDKIRKSFFLNGYNEIQTPTLEFFDVFSQGKASMEQEQMFKLFDPEGRILVLRPDITMPIARIVGTKLKDSLLPLRLSYFGNVYRYEEFQSCKQREVAQAGIELVGVEKPEADAEVIAIAIETFLDLGLKEFQIDIGQVEFLKGLIEEAGLSAEQAENIRSLIDQKNMLALEILLNDLPISQDIKNILYSLPQLYGDGDMLKGATGLSNNPRCEAAIDNINQVYKILKGYGFQQYISFDLGMVQSFNFYTGIIFRGITKELGYPICGGGRYDRLVSEFGYDLPATGFAMGIKRLLIALERQQGLEMIPKIDILLVAVEEAMGKAYQTMQQLKQQGKRVEMFLPTELTKDPMAYARQKGISKIVEVDSSSIREIQIDNYK